VGIALADYLLFRHGSRLAPALAPEVGRWVAPAVTLTLLGLAAGLRRAGIWLLLALLALGGRNRRSSARAPTPTSERAASANAAIVLCGRLTEVISRPDGGWQASSTDLESFRDRGIDAPRPDCASRAMPA
jgi:hypothetical protein